MEASQQKVQTAVTSALNTLDKEVLRKMQARMYQCSIKCCETDHYNMEEVQRCLDHCSHPVQQAQNTVQNELQYFQDRLQRCALDCQDKARDELGTNSTDDRIASAKRTMETCVLSCVDSHVTLLPGLIKKLKTALNK